MIMKSDSVMLANAIRIATLAHHGQFDKGGSPYILHPLAVMEMVRSERSDDVVAMCIAVLHDVLEDTDWTVEMLRAEGMSEEVIDGLLLMCHAAGEDYFAYIHRMSSNLRVLRVKKRDIQHNMDIRRLKGLRPKDFARLEKYSKAYVLIEKLIENLLLIESFKKENTI